MLEIALGIILAVVILALLPAIIAVGVFALAVAVVIGGLAWRWVSVRDVSWQPSDVAALALMCGLVLSLFLFAKVGDYIEKRTAKKVLSGECLRLFVFIPAVIYMGVLVGREALIAGAGGYLPNYMAIGLLFLASKFDGIGEQARSGVSRRR